MAGITPAPSPATTAPHTGLPEHVPTPFVLLDHVHMHTSQCWTATRAFQLTPLWQGVEAMAQLAALHLRHQVQFQRHAFLLSLATLQTTLHQAEQSQKMPRHSTLHATAPLQDNCSPCTASQATATVPLPHNLALHGTAHITIQQQGASDSASAYTATLVLPVTLPGTLAVPATPHMTASLRMAASLHIGLTPYDNHFRRELLEPRYRDLHTWLTRSLTT